MILIAMQKSKYPSHWMDGGEENVRKPALLSPLVYIFLELGFQILAKPLVYFHLNKKKPGQKRVTSARVPPA